MIVFLKNTVAQVNVETQKGNAPVVRVQCVSGKDDQKQKHSPKGVDAVTGGTQGISHYFAAQTHLQPTKPDSDET
jgi:hypothetical protein